MKKLPASKVILQGRRLGQMITVIVDCATAQTFLGRRLGRDLLGTIILGAGSNGEKMRELHYAITLLPVHSKKVNFGPEITSRSLPPCPSLSAYVTQVLQGAVPENLRVILRTPKKMSYFHQKRRTETF